MEDFDGEKRKILTGKWYGGHEKLTISQEKLKMKSQVDFTFPVQKGHLDLEKIGLQT